MSVEAATYDVAILGGGLAGLTLAIQIRKRRPETSVLVLEKRPGPAPAAAFKVGESTVLSGATYFADVVGMRDHLEQQQLPKNGLRFFLPADGNRDITKRVESGPPAWPPTHTFQIDRGIFENELAERALAHGAELRQGAFIDEIELGDDRHSVTFVTGGPGGDRTAVKARWIVDAAGRASLLKRKLGLTKEVEHAVGSAWFRLAGGLDLEQWGAGNEAWMGRMAEPGTRRFSTNHLLGDGYWVWLIPLVSGPISIGVCADPAVHPFEELSDWEGMLDWLHRHEPQLAAAVENRADDVEDFLRIEHFAYGVERICSADRWTVVGEAGAFADPFLSPGSDMIALSNTFTCDLVTRDLDGEEIGARIDYFNDFYQRVFEHLLCRTEHFYPVFGNPWVASIKLHWDAWLSFCGVVLCAVKQKLTDLEFMQTVDGDVDRLFRLNINMHRLLRQWHELEQRPWENDMLKTGLVGVIREGFIAPLKEYTDDELRATIAGQVRVTEALAVAIFHKAAGNTLPDPPSPDVPVNPYAVSLIPDEWEARGLHDNPGLTLAEAKEAVEGVDWLWLDHIPAQA